MSTNPGMILFDYFYEHERNAPSYKGQGRSHNIFVARTLAWRMVNVVKVACGFTRM